MFLLNVCVGKTTKNPYISYGIAARSKGTNITLRKEVNDNDYYKYYQRGEGVASLAGLYCLLPTSTIMIAMYRLDMNTAGFGIKRSAHRNLPNPIPLFHQHVKLNCINSFFRHIPFQYDKTNHDQFQDLIYVPIENDKI